MLTLQFKEMLSYLMLTFKSKIQLTQDLFKKTKFILYAKFLQGNIKMFKL